jgi:hypothetical protein
MYWLVACLRFRQDLADEVDWSLDWVGVAIFLPLDVDGSTDHVSSRGEVEQSLLLFARSCEDCWLGQEILELSQSLFRLFGPHELLLVLE